jgi:hypothetical protein
MVPTWALCSSTHIICGVHTSWIPIWIPYSSHHTLQRVLQHLSGKLIDSENLYAQSHLAAVNLWQERVGIHYHAGCLWPGSGHVCDLAGFNCARPPIRFRGARERQPSNPVHLHALLCSYRQRLTTSSGQCCNCTQDGAWTLWPSGRAAVARRKSCVLAWRLLVRSRDY